MAQAPFETFRGRSIDIGAWRRVRALVCLCAVLSGATAAARAQATALAFPGAEGAGAYAKGGRGGVDLLVSNLLDYDPETEAAIPGSLRAAVDLPGPRIVTFAVAGTIPLKRPLDVTEPFLTIDGQRAPDGGICLRDYALVVRTHDVIIRYVRARPGDVRARELFERGIPHEPDAITIAAPSRDVIVDHCSASWAIDECLSVSGAGITNVTVQWCIISESLDDSFHPKGPHGYGSLIRTNGHVSFHHNLYAHHRSRCPRPGTYGEGSITLDFRNNVVYDGTGYTSDDPARINYVGNLIQRPRGAAFSVGRGETRIYAQDNRVEGAAPLFRNARDHTFVQTPFALPAVTTTDPQTAYDAVLRDAGATLPKRDAVDARIVEQVRTNTGAIINSQAEVGAWPDLGE